MLIERIDVLEEIMNEESVGISTLKEAELNKLHERIGNYILKNYKKTDKVPHTFSVHTLSSHQNHFLSFF